MRPGDEYRPFQRFKGSLVPEALSRYRGASAGAKLVFARLARYQGESGDAYPSVATIGAECGVGESVARDYIQELVRLGFIQVRQRPGGSSTYVFVWHRCFDGDIGEPRRKPSTNPNLAGSPVRNTGRVGGTEYRTGTPSENRTPTPTEYRTGGVRNTVPEESHLRESIEEESSSSFGCTAELTDPGASEPLTRPTTTSPPSLSLPKNPDWTPEQLRRARAALRRSMDPDGPVPDAQITLQTLNSGFTSIEEFDAFADEHAGKRKNGWGFFPKAALTWLEGRTEVKAIEAEAEEQEAAAEQASKEAEEADHRAKCKRIGVFTDERFDNNERIVLVEAFVMCHKCGVTEEELRAKEQRYIEKNAEIARLNGAARMITKREWLAQYCETCFNTGFRFYGKTLRKEGEPCPDCDKGKNPVMAERWKAQCQAAYEANELAKAEVGW